jgi:hypothetical protein
VASLLGHRLGGLEATDPDRAGSIGHLLENASPDLLHAVVIAPETSFRLMWQIPADLADDDFWSYLTDALDSAGNHNAREPRVAGIAVDSLSQAAVRMDPNAGAGLTLCHYRTKPQRVAALRKLASAMTAIEATDPCVAAFVRRFTLVASIVTDSEGTRFSSGSVNQYVGRSIFWNAHHPSVDIGLLAEALVHEAIHGFLYMHEACEPWFVEPERIPTHPVVTSPWSGARLRLEPFTQACFVWFGLMQFWRIAERSAVFPAGRADKGVASAATGFCKGPLLSHIPGLQHHLRAPLAEKIERIQEIALGIFKRGGTSLA